MHSFDLARNDINDTLKLVANYLNQLLLDCDKLESQGLTVFHARSIPSIDVFSYLQRIQKYCPASNECYLALLYYILNIMKKVNSGQLPETFTVDSYSIHRLIISAVLTSAKFFSDVFFTNSRYAKVGGIPVLEMNRLEVEFLLALQFQLHVSINDLQTVGNRLLNEQLPTRIEDIIKEGIHEANTDEPPLSPQSLSSNSSSDISTIGHLDNESQPTNVLNFTRCQSVVKQELPILNERRPVE